jgi:hypothetical protein
LNGQGEKVSWSITTNLDLEDQEGMPRLSEEALGKRKGADDDEEEQPRQSSIFSEPDWGEQLSPQTVCTSEHPRLTTISPEALARLDYLSQLLSKMPTHVPPPFSGGIESPYDFTTLRPSKADIKEFGYEEAVLRLLNYQFHGEHVVYYPGDIVLRPHASWMQLVDALKESISLAAGGQFLDEYIEELIAACQGEIHEARVEAKLRRGNNTTLTLYPEPAGPSSPTRPAGAVKQEKAKEKAKASRPKARMKTKAPNNLDNSGAKGITPEEEDDKWMAANTRRERARVRPPQAESSLTRAAKNRHDDPPPGARPSRGDICPIIGLAPNLNAFYQAETSAQARLTKGAFQGYVVRWTPD